MSFDSDLALAQQLQAEFDLENEFAANAEVADLVPEAFRTPGKKSTGNDKTTTSLVAPEWEDLDPTPDLHALFLEFNKRFFWNKLLACEVKWSPRMTVCAGLCSYQRRSGYCSIRLSVPLLKLRPRSDLVETLLHEMIHAYLFVTDGNDDHDGHGPAFHEHMYRINKEAGTKISVYHNFHDEVALYKTHWWRCDGPCQQRKPFFGYVKRSMNRAPGPNDRWFADHQASCGGNFIKIKEPEDYGKKKPGKRKLELEKDAKKSRDIRSFLNKNSNTTSASSSQASTSTKSDSNRNIFGFGGTSFPSPGVSGASSTLMKGKSGTIVINPGKKVPKDNSNQGESLSPVTPASSVKLSSLTNGNVLGGKKDKDGNCDNAKEAVRNAWIKKYDKENENEVNPQPVTTNCPVCSKSIPFKNMNSHLDECLTLQTLNEERK